jgi:pSer/pThr/pTyr-binding forkhead associated (FHA) protein
MIELEIIVPNRSAVRRKLDWGTYSIGRALVSDVRLKHDSVAKHHAQLTITGEQLSLAEADTQHGLYKDG